MIDNKEMYNVYIISDLVYRKEFKNSKEELYPYEWNSINNYKLKLEIINDAIRDNILINYTKKYKDYIKNK